MSSVPAVGRIGRLRSSSGWFPRRMGLRAVAVGYLLIIVLLPLVAIMSTGFKDGLTSLTAAIQTNGAQEAIKLTLLTSAAAAITNAVFGTLLAYVLVRIPFRGSGLLSTFVDLPFAIPTLVTGVMLVALYGPGSPVGRWLQDAGIQIAFAPLGIFLALLFVTLPFSVRTVQPVLAELDPAEEEAARVLGAGPWMTFRKIVLPALRPSIAGGALLSFARAIGEFGAVVIISGNITNKTLTAPVFIFQLTSQFRFAEGAAVATLLFLISFTLVMVTDRVILKNTGVS